MVRSSRAARPAAPKPRNARLDPAAAAAAEKRKKQFAPPPLAACRLRTPQRHIPASTRDSAATRCDARPSSSPTTPPACAPAAHTPNAAKLSAFDQARAAAKALGSYQAGAAVSGGDSFARACALVEDDVRKFAAGVAALRKLAESIGGARDSPDVRARVAAGVARARDATAAISAALKGELATEAERADLSPKEKGARRLQAQRYAKDYKDAVAAYQEVRRGAGEARGRARRAHSHPHPTPFPPPPPRQAATLVQEKTRAHPTPKGGSVVDAAGARKVGGGKGGARVGNKAEEDALLRMQQVDFEESLVDEREEAITDIAQAISEVNETFRDLAQIVEDQGKDIETIEVNVTTAEARTAEGVGHLESAEKSQKGYRKWLLVLACIVFLIAASVGGFIGYEHWKNAHPGK